LPPVDALLAATARLDALLALAATSRLPGYCRPRYTRRRRSSSGCGSDLAGYTTMEVSDARHPIMEQLLQGDGGSTTFVPNDITLSSGVVAQQQSNSSSSSSSPRCLVLTGPNMGGKSCYARTAALVAILGQVGSFVPATSARLPAFDAVFTRMGASDDLAAGRSTFLVELERASQIIRRATPRSLVVLDELGRGTSTHDGVAIAIATLRHLAGATATGTGATETQGPRCATIFVTHYPAVAAVEQELAGADGPHTRPVMNAHMGYLEHESVGTGMGGGGSGGSPVDNYRVTFLYKLERGVAERSFGLNVARLAGLPICVLDTAHEKAKMLA
jgi:DNA mismatch repair protein MSH3